MRDNFKVSILLILVFLISYLSIKIILLAIARVNVTESVHRKTPGQLELLAFREADPSTLWRRQATGKASQKMHLYLYPKRPRSDKKRTKTFFENEISYLQKGSKAPLGTPLHLPCFGEDSVWLTVVSC